MEKLIACMLAIDGAEKTEHLWHSLNPYLFSHGVKSIFYRHIPLITGDDFNAKYLYTSNLSISVRERYITERYYEFDISQMIEFTRGLGDGWLTRQVLETVKAPKTKFADFLLDVMSDEILILPVYGASNRSGYFCLSFKKPRTEISIGVLRSCEIACHYTHGKYVHKMTEKGNKLDSLSSREIEILHWVAKGKSNSVIADNVGISRHTVDTYLRRIFIKLEASDRITATLKAINMGLIIS